MEKLFMVELKMNAVIFAESDTMALQIAQRNLTALSIGCGGMIVEDATELRSLEHLKKLDTVWDEDSIPFLGDGVTPLKSLLLECEPHRDTKTIDMFESAAHDNCARSMAEGQFCQCGDHS